VFYNYFTSLQNCCVATEMSEQQLTSALNLMRRMPPSTIENSLAGLLELVPDLADDLLSHVDQPLKLQRDTNKGRDFILCDYNREGDSYRSPWSNQYFPASDGFLPSSTLRKLEVDANDIFDTYRKLYFEGGISSVYFFNTTEEKDDTKAFGACFLIHKDVEGSKGLESGWWDSMHIFEVVETKKNHFEYKLTSTVMVSMKLKSSIAGDIDISGSQTQQDTKVLPLTAEYTHIANLGGMLEERELKIRSSIEGIAIQKTREVVNGMRPGLNKLTKQWEEIAQSLNMAVLKHGERKDDKTPIPSGEFKRASALELNEEQKKLLVTGAMFNRHMADGDPKQRQLSVSEDLKVVVVKDPAGKDETISLPLNKIRSVDKGLCTKELNRKKGAQPVSKADCSFAIHESGREFNVSLEAKSSADRDQWVTALSILLKSKK